jgi:hypothetical protein
MAQAYIKDKNPAPPVALGPLVLNTRGQAFAIKRKPEVFNISSFHQTKLFTEEDDHLVTKDIFESAQLCEKAKEPTKAKESTRTGFIHVVFLNCFLITSVRLHGGFRACRHCPESS